MRAREQSSENKSQQPASQVTPWQRSSLEGTALSLPLKTERGGGLLRLNAAQLQILSSMVVAALHHYRQPHIQTTKCNWPPLSWVLASQTKL